MLHHSLFAFKRKNLKLLEVKYLKFISFPLIRRPRFLSLSQTSILSFIRMSEQQMLVPHLEDIMVEIRVETEETTAKIVEKFLENDF